MADQVRRFWEDLERAGVWQDWQVRQTGQALRIYFVNFLQRTDWPCPGGRSNVVDLFEATVTHDISKRSWRPSAPSASRAGSLQLLRDESHQPDPLLAPIIAAARVLVSQYAESLENLEQLVRAVLEWRAGGLTVTCFDHH